MHALSFFLLPLLVPAIAAWFPDADNKAYRMAFRGGIVALPALAVWLLSMPLHQPAWGSALLVLSVFLRYFFLPAGLFAAGYALSLGMTKLDGGTGYKGALHFSLGFFGVFNLAFAILGWGQNFYAWTLVLPVLVAATALALPQLLESAVRYGMPDGLRWIAAATGGLLLASTAYALLFLRLEWLGLVLSVGYSAGAVFMGLRKLLRAR